MLELLVFKRLDEDARMRGFESCIRASNSTASAVRGPPEGLYAADLTKSLPIRIIWLAVCKTLAGGERWGRYGPGGAGGVRGTPRRN